MTSSNSYSIDKKAAPTFYFIGVTTKNSAIRAVFPRWMDILDRPEVQLEGVDHPLGDQPEAYRATVAQIKYDPHALGGLVTSHKINLLQAARDLFDRLHQSTRITGEISCISKRRQELWGHAKDPLTSGMCLDAILGPEYFARSGGHVLCFGAGGAGKAIALHLATRPEPGDRPERMTVTDLHPEQLANLRRMIADLETDVRFEYELTQTPEAGDQAMANLPDGSLIINATGAGKDFPGSPISDAAEFPWNGIAWEINYRGELDFWHQAVAQKTSRQLTVEDGWLYFLHGWTQVISEVLDLEIDPATFEELSTAASDLRPALRFKPRPAAEEQSNGCT